MTFRTARNRQRSPRKRRSRRRIELVSASLASGKTFQASMLAVQRANRGQRVFISTPDHSVCREVMDNIAGMGLQKGRTAVHLFGRRDDTCVHHASRCGSCPCGSTGKNISVKGGVFDLAKLKAESRKLSLCPRTLSILLAEKAEIVVFPKAFLINRGLRRHLRGRRPDVHVDDEGDTLSDWLVAECTRTFSLLRCSKMGRCELECPGAGEDKAEPTARIQRLRKGLAHARALEAEGTLKSGVLDLGAIERNLSLLEQAVLSHREYLEAGEERLTVRRYLERQAKRLLRTPPKDTRVEETGAVFFTEQEPTSYPVLDLEKTILEAPTHDRVPSTPGSTSYFDEAQILSREYRSWKATHPQQARQLQDLLEFAEFCQFGSPAVLAHPVVNTSLGEPCQILLLGFDRDYFQRVVGDLRRTRTIMMSGTYLEPRMAAASLLLNQEDVDYLEVDVNLHDEVYIVIHNAAVGRDIPGERRRGNRSTPKELPLTAPAIMMEQAAQGLEDDLSCLVFARSKAIVERMYGLLRGHPFSSRAQVKRYDGSEIITDRSNDRTSGVERGHDINLDYLRSTGSRGVNRGYFDLVYQEGNGRPNFSQLAPFVLAINDLTNTKVTLREVVNYNRNRAVVQALMRIPRDGQKKRVVVHAGDMSILDFPKLMWNRIVDARDIYRAYLERVETEDGESISHWQARVLGQFFVDVRAGTAPRIGRPSEPEEPLESKSIVESIEGYTQDRWRKVVEVIDGRGHFMAGEERVGRKKTWYQFLRELARIEVLSRKMEGRSTLYLPGPRFGDVGEHRG